MYLTFFVYDVEQDKMSKRFGKKKEGNSQIWCMQPATKVNKRIHWGDKTTSRDKTTVSEQREECKTEEGHPSY